MDKIKQVLHPKEPAHQAHNGSTNEPTTTAHPHHHHDHPSSSSPSGIPPGARPDQQTLDRLGSEPNVTGTSRPPPHEDFPSAHHNNNTAAAATTATRDEPKINRGHHHPRQPVGAAGTPAGHGGAASAGAGAVGAGESGAHHIKAQAEAGNNFPGTNPNPSHSA